MSKTEELYIAIKAGRLDSVENYLSQPGIKPNKTFDGGYESLLSAAVRQGSVAMVDLLVAKGAKVDLKVQNKTALHMAAYEGYHRVVNALLGHGANLEAKDDTGRTALHWAARQGHHAVYKMLRESDAGVENIADDGNTLLHDAAFGGDLDIVKDVLSTSGGAGNVRATNEEGDAPIHLSAEEGHTTVIEALVNKGAKLDDVNGFQQNVLHIAVKAGHLRVVKYLIENLQIPTTLLNAPTKDTSYTQLNKVKTATKNWAPLHFACGYGHYQIAKYLLNNGANKTQRTKDGLRPVDVCKAYKQTALVPLFMEEAKDESNETKVGDKREYMNRKVHHKVKVTATKKIHHCKQ